MSSVVIIKGVQVKLTIEQLRAALRQLSTDELEKVLRDLDMPNWQERFDLLVERVRERADKHPISDEEIDEEVERVRSEISQ